MTSFLFRLLARRSNVCVMSTRNEPLRYLGWIGLGTIVILALVAIARDANAEYAKIEPHLRAAAAVFATTLTLVGFALFGWAF